MGCDFHYCNDIKLIYPRAVSLTPLAKTTSPRDSRYKLLNKDKQADYHSLASLEKK